MGCDHGYLPVYVMLNHKIPGAIATDVGKGPLARAQEHISKYGMGQYIETRLCDGLKGVHSGEGDTLVIAGMGGPLMERILTEGAEALNGFKELILLFERLHRVLFSYLERELRIREEISGQLEKAAGEGAKKRLNEVEEEKQLILAALHRYESKGTDRLA